MTTEQPSNTSVPATGPRQRWPSDIILAAGVVVLFVAHIALILVQVCPYWSICFPFTPFAPYVWPVVAVGLAAWLSWRAIRSEAGRPGRRARLTLAALLVFFAADTLTGGDYRWFEMAMRREMRQCGGPAALQAWAQGVLTSPEQVAHLEDHDVDPKSLPPEIRSFAARVCEYPHAPLYRLVKDGGPWFMFAQGGWDMGCGIIVGKSDLVDPSPVNLPNGQHRGWTMRLQPGVYLYAF